MTSNVDMPKETLSFGIFTFEEKMTQRKTITKSQLQTLIKQEAKKFMQEQRIKKEIPLEWFDALIDSDFMDEDGNPDISQINPSHKYLIVFSWDGGSNGLSGDLDKVIEACQEKMDAEAYQELYIYDRTGRRLTATITGLKLR